MTPSPAERARTLQELEGHDWGEPEFQSYLVATVHRLRRKLIGAFSVEDLRIMIGQNVGERYLVPMAVERLQSDPLAEGDFYPGDLLGAVLRVRHSFWVGRPDLREAVGAIAERALLNIADPDAVTRDAIIESLEAFNRVGS